MPVKSYKYRFYPTAEQEQILAQTFGCVRFVFNKALALRTSTYKETRKGIGYSATSGNLTQWKREVETSFLSGVSSVPLQQCLRHLDRAFSNFFKKQSKYPRFKSKRSRQSAEYTRSGFKWNKQKQQLTIARLGVLDIRWSRRFKADPSTVTISKTPTGKYYVAIRIDEPNRSEQVANSEVGIDLGIKSLAVTSGGITFDNDKLTAKYSKKLAKAQRVLARRVKGSNRRRKSRIKVARIHEKIANARLDRTHKITTQLIRENQAIYVENLAVSNMVKNRKLAKSISDCGWFEFVRQLKYKAEWYGRDFVQIGRFEPTSKTCSCCGFNMPEMPLSVRNWDCPECNAKHDRDVNAARNILAVGRTVKGRGVEEDLQPVLSGRRHRRRSVKQLEVLHK